MKEADGAFPSAPVFLDVIYMNKAANTIANAVLGEDRKVIVLAGKARIIEPPTIATICRAITFLSNVDRTSTGEEHLDRVKSDLENMLKGLAVFLFGDPERYKEIENASLAELKEALTTVIKLISAEDFFVCAALAESVARMAATQK